VSFDLTNKNIQDTFQNLLQRTGSEGHLYDLVGNQVDNLTIGGTLTANSYVTSESVVNTSSGSTAFGNSSDDSHTFQGHITASGDISGSSTSDIIIGGSLTLAGDSQNGIFMNASEPEISLNPDGVATAKIGYTENSIRLNNSSLSFSTVGHLVVSSSGLTTADALVGVGVEKPTSTLDVGGNINTTSHITASGDISASGKVITSQVGDGNDDLLLRADNVTIQADTNGDITFKEGVATRFKYNGTDDEFEFSKGLDVTGNITASGTINASSVQVDGTSIVTNVVTTATQGSFNQIKGGFAGVVQLADLGTTGNPKFNHITASGNISGSGGDILGFNSGSFNYITASIIDVDGDTIRMGGEPFTKANIQALKQGKSLKPLGVGKVNPDILAGDITASGDIRNTQTLQMTNSSSIVNTFNTGSIRSSKYVLQVTSASNYQVSEMLVLHNDGTTLNTEYAQLNSGVNLVDFSTKVINQNVELIASSSFISCSVKFERTIIPT